MGGGHHLLAHGRGFLYLVIVMDWHSRYVVAWRLSNTLEAGFCAEALEEALGKDRPEVFNTGQGASSPAWSSPRSSRSKGYATDELRQRYLFRHPLTRLGCHHFRQWRKRGVSRQ